MPEIKTIVYECDNPTCPTVRVPEEFDDDGTVQEPALGFHLNAFQVSKTGGNSAAAYACSEDCITPAIIDTLRRALEF